MRRHMVLLAVYLVCSILITGCSVFRVHQCCTSVTGSSQADWYTNYFDSFPNSTSMKVLVSRTVKTNQHSILLLHELPGMTPECLTLATNIAAQGFTVYLPLMFGKPGDTSGLWHSFRNAVHLSFSPRWHIYRKARTSPIAGDLRKLVRDINRVHGTNAMGVIGMCLTGSLPLTLLQENSVCAVVLSQPAVPIVEISCRQKAALGLSVADLRFATNRVAKEHIPVIGLRFETDKICQSPRFHTLRREFGDEFVDLTISKWDYDDYTLQRIKTECMQPHSVLCENYNNAAGSPTRIRFESIINYFQTRLR